jgi:hypothetical protein
VIRGFRPANDRPLQAAAQIRKTGRPGGPSRWAPAASLLRGLQTCGAKERPVSIALQASTPEDVIKMRAYAIWEDEGRPEGKHLEHWRSAAQEVAEFAEAPKQAAAPVPRKASRAKGVK